MTPEDFEASLKRQPLRPVPSDWKRDILASATASREDRASRMPIVVALREWLWPHPVAWAGIAAVWIAMAVMQFPGPPSASLAKEPVGHSRNAMLVLNEQRRAWNEFITQLHTRSATHDPKSSTPNTNAPRSDRRARSVTA